MTSVAKAIKELRMYWQESQPELANRLEVSIRSLARYESGEHKVPDWVKDRLCTEAIKAGRPDLAEQFITENQQLRNLLEEVLQLKSLHCGGHPEICKCLYHRIGRTLEQ